MYTNRADHRPEQSFFVYFFWFFFVSFAAPQCAVIATTIFPYLLFKCDVEEKRTNKINGILGKESMHNARTKWEWIEEKKKSVIHFDNNMFLMSPERARSVSGPLAQCMYDACSTAACQCPANDLKAIQFAELHFQFWSVFLLSSLSSDFIFISEQHFFDVNCCFWCIFYSHACHFDPERIEDETLLFFSVQIH